MIILSFILGFIFIGFGVLGSIGFSKKYFSLLMNKPYDEYANDLRGISAFILLLGILIDLGTIIASSILG